MRRRRPPIWATVMLALFAGVIGVSAIVAVGAGDAAKRPAEQPAPTKLTLPAGTNIADLRRVEVVKVIDGDTIDVKIDGKTQRIRYYGVDTPERGDRCFREATDRNEHLVGSTVLLLNDARNEDRYERLLRYVFLADGTSVDATLVAEGFGRAWRQDGRYKDQIVTLEDNARTNDRGCLWK
jgi:micrococcal nuclease